MTSHFRSGSRSWWMAMVVLAVVGGTMAAPQQDRHKIKVGAAFGGRSDPDSTGNSRALSQFEEPHIITEPLPGQEFVFISANPRQSQAAGGRTAKVNSIPAQVPSVRFENSGSGAVLEDGILIAEHLGESNRAARFLDEPSGQPTFPVQETDTTFSWSPLSLPALLTGPAIVREQEPASSIKSNISIQTEEVRSLSPAPVVETFSFQDAVRLAPALENIEQVAAPVAIEESARQSKSMDDGSQDDDNLITAESVSRRTVIKTAPNGQDYEYEYLYYDGIDIDEANTTTSVVSPQEPTLFSNDQENVNASPMVTNGADNGLSSDFQPPSFPAEEEVSVTTELDLVEVQEIPHVQQAAVHVDDIAHDDKDEFMDAFTTEHVDIIDVTEEAATATAATMTTTSAAPSTTAPVTTASFRRRRPTAVATTEATMRPSLSRIIPLRRGSTSAVSEEPIVTTIDSHRIRGKNRFSSESLGGIAAVNAVATQSKTDGSGRRRLHRPRIRPSTTSTLENRAGLAEVRFEEFEGDMAEAHLADAADDASLGTLLGRDELDFSHQSQPIGRFPTRDPMPENFQEEQDAGDIFVQERTPLRVVESDSFRNAGNQGSLSELPVSVGRLTVISGPARLPTPLVVHQFEDVAEKEEIEGPNFAPGQDFVQGAPQVDAEFAADIPAAEEEELVDEVNHQEVVEGDVHMEEVSPFSLNHPSLSDILAFSKAAEQQQQDDKTVPVHDFDEVVIEEVLPTTAASVIPSATLAPQVHSIDDQFVTETFQDADTPVNQHVQLDVTDFVDEIMTTPDSVAVSVEPVSTAVSSGLGLADIEQTTDVVLEDVVAEDDDVQTNSVADITTETSTAAISTATAPATTTTTVASTTTPEPTTTEAPVSSVRTPSRFGGSIGNINRFNSRLRNRVRGGSDNASAVASPTSTTTTTTTTAAPVRKNTFRPTVSRFNRLRRPTTPPTDTVKTMSSEAVDAAVEVSVGSSPVSAVPSVATRRPLSNNFRNRFQFRRNQTEASKAVDSSAVSEEPKAVLPTAKPRPVATSPLQNNRIVVPRPMSSILRRGRFTTTTTTTEATPVGASAEETSTNETPSETEQTKETSDKTEGDAVDAAEPDSVSEKVDTVATEPTTTTTTTSRSAGLNRLRNRVSFAVSERPKTVRTQVSLSDRRNRFSVLSAKRPVTETDSSVANEENKEEKPKTVDDQEEEVTDKETQASAVVSEGSADSSPDSEANVDAVSSATEAPAPTLRNRRPSRIPGQLVARRT